MVAAILALFLSAHPAEPSAPAPAPPAVAPLPRTAGDPRPEPDFAARRSGLSPQVLAAWVRNLGDDDYETREAAETGLLRAGWDGYAACRSPASASPCPETRARAGRVCGRYLSVPMPKKPCGIYRLNGTYTAWVVEPNHLYNTEVEIGGPPTAPDTRALVSHWYMLRAVLVEWDAETKSGGPARWGRNANGQGPVFYKYRTTHCEELATRIMARDLLTRGVSREWVAWLLDDMTRRKCVYPRTISDPPWWLVAAMGFTSDK